MFAYCQNNPANGCDPCGTCFHNLKFYDCEKCSKFWNGVGEFFVEAYNNYNDAYLKQQEIQIENAKMQNELIGGILNDLWDIHVHNVTLEIQAQQEKDAAIRKAAKILSNDSAMAIDLVINPIGLGTS